MSNTKIQVAHIIPAMVYGGVEIAISKTYKQLNKYFTYDIYYVRYKGEFDIGQKNITALLKNVITGQKKYDVIITSLWWSHIIGFLVLILGFKWVPFIHSTGAASFMDKIIHYLTLRLSSNIIFDSESTKSFYMGEYSAITFVVPYVFNENSNVKKINKNALYDFSWIGRNSKEKRIDLLVKLIKTLDKKLIKFKSVICIAGNNYKILDNLKLNVSSKIKLQYNVAPEKIGEINRNSKMILCLSDYEGFSASTAEAVLRGNYVAARKIGDLPNYLCSESTIWLEDTDDQSWSIFINKIINTLGNDNEIFTRRINSQKYTGKILGKSSYIYSMKNSICTICNKI